MNRVMITAEYPLTAKSPGIVWNMISTPAGLEMWIANRVVDNGDGTWTFTWGETKAQQDSHVSALLGAVKNKRIRLKWDYIEEDYAYWEMKIEKSEITGHLNLVITDFAYPDDTDYLYSLWDDNLARLHQISGL